MSHAVDRCPDQLCLRVFEIQSLHVGGAKVGDRGACAMDVEASLCYLASFAAASGDDDVRVPIHETSSFERLDDVNGCCDTFVSYCKSLRSGRSFAEGIDCDLTIGILGSVDGQNVSDGLGGVLREPLHGCMRQHRRLLVCNARSYVVRER